MRFFRPSWLTILPPSLLVAFAFVPSLVLRQFFYGLLALPLWPAIKGYNLVYRDKPQFLTPEAAIFAASFWALLLYLFLCTLRSFFRKA